MNEILQFNDPVGTIVGFKITSSDLTLKGKNILNILCTKLFYFNF